MKFIRFALFSFIFLPRIIVAQTVPAKLVFVKGETIGITMEVKSTIAQEAMGQTIDFTIDASSNHSYKVTNTTDENTTLNHQVQHISFAFDGMGQKRDFDSNKEKDITGQMGKPVKELLEKKYDIIIDSTGNTLMAIPETIQLKEGDSRMAIIFNLIKDVTAIVQPPKKGSASFFKLLPSSGAAKGSTWTETNDANPEKDFTNYTLTDITDSTFVIGFTASSVTVTTAEMMGNTTTTTLNNKSTGKIIADKATGIIVEKTVATESTGNTEASFGTLPVTSKTSIVIKVKTEKP
jgi:Family of unknown function (DUF6263)